MGFKELYDAAGEDGKKDIKLDLWNLNRYISSVKGNYEKTALAVFKVNEYYNKNYMDVSKHQKLQWQLLCMSGGTGRIEYHPWIGFKKKTQDNNKLVKVIEQIYPNMKQDEVELLARISTKAEIKKLAEDHNIEAKL